ncbi:hypothetical protein HU200_011490 [Digitaria exilis]|uniref:Uncharacterized protein n=1 Tax=Digitaria exilis TaxID=1010633 RepID=A0A835FGJ4_9POAL|nr:hypothetical protein HU200_011490 [Digitaria exilis]
MESDKRRQECRNKPKPPKPTVAARNVNDIDRARHVLELILLRLDSSRWCGVVVDAGFLKRVRLLHVPVMGYYHNPSKGPSRQTPPRRSPRLKTLERGDPLRGTFTLELAFPPRSRLGNQARGRRSPSSGRFPSRSRPGKLELAGQARACYAGNSARDSKDSLRHATAHAAERTSVKSTWRGRSWQWHYANHSFDFACLGCATILEGNPRRKLRSFDPDAPELEGAIPARVVRGMGSTVHLAASAPRTHVLSRPPPYAYKRGKGSPCKRSKSQQEFISFSHLACNPLLRATRNRCSAPLLDVRPRGRNQDKNPCLSTRHRGNEWLTPQSLAPTHNYSDLPVFQHVPAWHDVSCPWEGTIDVHNTVGSFFFAGRANGSLYWGTVSRGSASRATAGVSQIAVPESIIGSYEAYLFRVIGSDDGTLRSMLGSMESGGEWVLQTRVRLPDVDTNYYLPMWRAVVVAVHETYVLVSPGYSRWLFSVDLRTMAVERVRERDVYYEEQAYPFEQQWPPTLRASPSSPIDVPARHWPNNHPPPPCQQAPSSTSPACTCLPLGPACVFTLRKLNVEFIGRMRVQNVLPLGLLGKLDPDSTTVCADVHAT